MVPCYMACIGNSKQASRSNHFDFSSFCNWPAESYFVIFPGSSLPQEEGITQRMYSSEWKFRDYFRILRQGSNEKRKDQY